MKHPSYSLVSELVLWPGRAVPGNRGGMKAGFLLLMCRNKLFHPEGIRKPPRGSQSNLAAGNGLLAEAEGFKGLGNILGITRW